MVFVLGLYFLFKNHRATFISVGVTLVSLFIYLVAVYESVPAGSEDRYYWTARSIWMFLLLGMMTYLVVVLWSGNKTGQIISVLFAGLLVITIYGQARTIDGGYNIPYLGMGGNDETLQEYVDIPWMFYGQGMEFSMECSVFDMKQADRLVLVWAGSADENLKLYEYPDHQMLLFVSKDFAERGFEYLDKLLWKQSRMIVSKEIIATGYDRDIYLLDFAYVMDD